MKLAYWDLGAHVYVVLTERDCVHESKYLAMTGFGFLWPHFMSYKAILRSSYVT